MLSEAPTIQSSTSAGRSRNRPNTADRPGSSVLRGKSPAGVGVVESRVRYNRNYQPPRRKKEVETEEVAETGVERYEADFESEEEYLEELDHKEDEDREEEKLDDHREAWLREQAERGKARQRALVSRLGPAEEEGSRRKVLVDRRRGTPERRPTVEKESSQDSAYGFSSDGLMPTREPTPEPRVMGGKRQEAGRRVLGQGGNMVGARLVAKQKKTVKIGGEVSLDDWII